jgi:hypothetical protein
MPKLPAIVFDSEGFSPPLLNAATGKIFYIRRRSDFYKFAVAIGWTSPAYYLASMSGEAITAPVSFIAALMLATERVAPATVPALVTSYSVTESDRQTNFGTF